MNYLPEGCTGELALIGRLHRGYDIRYVGAVYGLIWGLLDGLVAGAVVAWLYNGPAIRFTRDSSDEAAEPETDPQ